MKNKNIVVSVHDYDILKSICMQTPGSEKLKEELDRAKVVEADVPANVVQLNSQLQFKDERSGKVRSVQLVLPGAANIQEGKMSILSPIGTALLGLSVGQSIDWPLPNGRTKKLRIVKVTYQPEALGHYHL